LFKHKKIIADYFRVGYGCAKFDKYYKASIKAITSNNTLDVIPINKKGWFLISGVSFLELSQEINIGANKTR
jgi:hypothetical protein